MFQDFTLIYKILIISSIFVVGSIPVAWILFILRYWKTLRFNKEFDKYYTAFKLDLNDVNSVETINDYLIKDNDVAFWSQLIRATDDYRYVITKLIRFIGAVIVVADFIVNLVNPSVDLIITTVIAFVGICLMLRGGFITFIFITCPSYLIKSIFALVYLSKRKKEIKNER